MLLKYILKVIPYLESHLLRVFLIYLINMETEQKKKSLKHSSLQRQYLKSFEADVIKIKHFLIVVLVFTS